MTTIKVTPDQLLSVSKQFAAAQSQIAQMNHMLKQQLFEIERQWNGSTKERFYADFLAAQRVMDNFSSLSLSIAKTLEGHAEKFRLADQQAVQAYDANCVPPPPEACRAPVADTRNFFQKSADSLAELGTAFMQAADDRYQKRYDSVGGFLDYWTFGIPSGLVEGYMDRANKAFDSPNDTANWLTLGIHGTIREAIFPTNAWSSEHWANMMGMGGMMVGGGMTAKMIKPHKLLTSSGGGTKIGAFNRPPGTWPNESKKARNSSEFSEFVQKEKSVVEGKGKVHPNGTPNPTHNAKGEQIDNVEVPKVKFTSITEYMKQEDIAHHMYTNFKTMKNDISDISISTGWKEADIRQIKNHLFIEKHKFDNGQVKLFDPNYQQAMAWERLIQGDYNKNDILLLNHELFESNYMKRHGATYEQGHAEAQKYYNWLESVYED